MAKVKNKRNSGLADRVINKKKGDITKKKLNPFEVHINREKIKVLGQKSKHDRGLPGVSRSKAIKKRKETLGVEMKLMNKTNTFIDRRIGEKDSQLSSDDKTLARFAAERAKQHSKKNIYNLADDEVLTHRGQTLEQIEKFDDPRSSDDEDDDGRKVFGGLNDEFVAESHFGGGILSKTEKDGAKSHKDLIEQLIAESKKRKHEKQKEKEQTLDLTEKLDSEWRDLQPVVMKRSKMDDDGEKQDYDKVMRELKFDRRGTPSDGLKSQEKKEKEEKKRLEELEREREQRMLGEENTTRIVPSKGKHRSAEDLDDNFALDEEPDFMLAYDNEGNPLLPEHILQANHVPNGKKQFNDGISDSSSDDDNDESDEESDNDESDKESENEINKAIGEPDKDTILFQKNDDSEDSDDDSDNGENDDEVNEETISSETVGKNDDVNKSDKSAESSSEDSENNDEMKTSKTVIKSDNKNKKIDKEESSSSKKSDEKQEKPSNPDKIEKSVENNTQKDNSMQKQKEIVKEETESESDDQNEDENDLSDDENDKNEDKTQKNKFDNFDDLLESESSSSEEDDVDTKLNLNFNDESEEGSSSDEENGKKSEKKNLAEFTMSYDEFKKSLLNKNPQLQSETLEKLIKKYDPSLAVNNKDILSKIYGYSLQYVNDIFTKLKTESDVIKSFLVFNKIVPFLYDLAHTNKVSTKALFIEVLKEKHDQFKRKIRRVPDLDTLIFFKLASLIYPTSDFKHPVTTPCFVFMSEILTLCKFRDAYSISRGLFLTALILEFTVLSKRLVPAALNFLKGVFYLAANTSILNPVQIIPPFTVHKDTKILILEEKCKKIKVENKMAAKDLVTDLNNEFKIRTVFTSVAMFKEFFELLNDLETPDYLFGSHLSLINRIDLDNYPKNFVEYLEKNVNEIKLVLEMKTYTPLAREKKRPKALRLYEPDVQEVFTGNKNWKLSKEQVERNKLKSKYKKEMKGAIRELRRDKAYVASVKIKQRIQSDNVRREKVKQIYKEASIQQGELNKIKRMK